MTTLHQEIVPSSEHEAREADRSSQESSREATKELFRRDLSPGKEEPLPPLEPSESPSPSPTSKTPSKPIIKTPLSMSRDSATKKKSNSGIPRLKPGSAPARSPKTGTYRHSTTSTLGPIINRNTLEVQFMNNKKRLMQMHSELVDRQRPLMEMHKSLMRTKKQLEDLGKKVVLEELKVISLKMDDPKMDGAGENPTAEVVVNLKSSIENTLDSCIKVCQKCFAERNQVLKMLESASKSSLEPTELETEVEELKKKEEDLEKTMHNTLKENEKKIAEVLDNWQKSIKMKILSNEAANKISDLEDTVRQQQKLLQEADDNLHSVTRKYEDKKATYEKTISEMQEKFSALEEDLKKEKKNANDNLMKSRNLRGKMAEMEARTKEAEEKSNDALQKLKQLQEQLRKKEIQWMKEKDDFKKNESLLQQKFIEKQNQFDTRLKDMENLQKSTEMQQKNFCRNFETQLDIKDQEFSLLEKERDALAAKSKTLEDQVEELRKQLDDKDKEIDEMSVKMDVPAIDYQYNENQWMELMEYKQKVTDTQNHMEQLNDQVNKMQSSLKAHAKLAAALKLEKDNAIKYSSKLREVLHEAKEELEFKNKTIYKIHEKLVLKDKAYEKLKAQMKELEACSEFSGDKWIKNRCQICMAAMGGEKTEHSSCVDTDVGKSYINSPQYVSESLIGMSVKKVDHLRARLDSLKKMKLPSSPGKNQLSVNYSWTHRMRESSSVNNNLRKQIELRGKLYQILQKHADQSCEDFINLLKLTVSNGGKGIPDELKPSNMKDVDETVKNSNPRIIASNIKTSESLNAISELLDAGAISEICDKLNESPTSDSDDFVY